jgi:putative transposase
MMLWRSGSDSTTNGRSRAATRINLAGLRISASSIPALRDSTSAAHKARCADWIRRLPIFFVDSKAPTGSTRFFTPVTATVSGSKGNRFCLLRHVDGTIKTLSLKREADKWFLVVTSDVGEPALVENILPAIGIDVGLTEVRHTLQTEKRLKTRNTSKENFLSSGVRSVRSPGKRKAGTTGRRRNAVSPAFMLEWLTLRREHQYKISNDLISRYGKIAVESLNVQGMKRNPRLARAISDVAWSSFVDVLTHKAERAGGEVRKVFPNGTSQECSAGSRTVPKSLKVRVHRCKCGLVMDRNQNAALNILRRAWPGTGQLSTSLKLSKLPKEAVSL